MIDLVKHLVDFCLQVVDFILHIDTHLQAVIAHYGTETYLMLFVIIFAETGLVVTPILPGDSLLFAAGALAAGTVLNVHLIVALLIVAAVLGNMVNYAVGAWIGPKVFSREDSWLLRKKHLESAHAFFEKYGGRSIILTRFMPIIRTFVPFVAGVGRMPYGRFFTYNLIGGAAWIAALTYLGYFFGGTEIVRKNFSILVIAIVAISLLPVAIELARAFLKRPRAGSV